MRNVLSYLNEVIHSIVVRFHARSAAIYSFDERRGSLILLARSGKSFKGKKLEKLKLGRELPRAILSKRHPFLVSDRKPFLSGCPSGSLLAIPISNHNKIYGLLLIHISKLTIGKKMILNLNTEVRLIGICLRSFDVLRSMSAEITGLKVVDDINKVVASELTLERLYQKLYDQVKRIVRVKNLRIDLLEPEGNRIKPVFFVHNGSLISGHPDMNINDALILGELYRKRKVILTSEYKKLYNKKIDLKSHSEMEVASFIGLPLVVRDNFLGVMMCWDKNRKNAFSEQTVRFLKLIASQSAIAINNARLFDQLNSAINNLTLLYQIEYHISSILSIEVLLRTAVSLIDAALGNIITTILIPDEDNKKLVIKAISQNAIVKSGFETVPMYRGVVGEAMKMKKAIYVSEAEKDERYFPAIEGVKSELAIPLIAGTRILGVIDFQSKIANRFDVMTLDLLDDIAHRISTFLENAILYERLEKSYTETIRALVLAMEAKDSYTRGHSERVTELALKLADEMGFTDGRKRKIYWAGLLHDIGKIGISESILNKPGHLDEFEFSEIKRHPEEGAKMLEPIEGLKEVVPLIRHHHENFDGTGYPDGLKGEEIPLESRILAVCDVFDAMTTIRSYRNPFSKEDAIHAIKLFSGTRLDPEIVKEFTKMMQKKGSKGRDK